ncbi:hypothetical protein LIER_43613 [Lithospermum erythrorhizon]|uniref:Integrase catalytic domain-containing protein n=1 Tax=Lithospermum erythrorhizon TaxID=34254 RepID=A0AAV3QH56_LITER
MWGQKQNSDEVSCESRCNSMRFATTYYNELPGRVYVEVCDQRAYEEEVVNSVADSVFQREDAPKVLVEVHEGWCGTHIGARSLTIKITSEGYYWPTLVKDETTYVKRCEAGQRMENMPQLPTSTLTPGESNLFCNVSVEGQVLADFCEKFGIEHRFTLVYYHQSNGQVKVMNHIVFKAIKKNILKSGKNRGSWIEELPTVLWSLCSTPTPTTGETPFSLVYGIEAVLLAEVGLPTYRQAGFDEEKNDQRLREYLNFTDELRDEALYKILNHPKEQSKLSQKWEGPYRVKRVIGPITYKIEELNGKPIPPIPRTWHASKLCEYYV